MVVDRYPLPAVNGGSSHVLRVAPLPDADKKKYELPLDGFASQVKHVDSFAQTMKSHDLNVGDIIAGS